MKSRLSVVAILLLFIVTLAVAQTDWELYETPDFSARFPVPASKVESMVSDVTGTIEGTTKIYKYAGFNEESNITAMIGIADFSVSIQDGSEALDKVIDSGISAMEETGKTVTSEPKEYALLGGISGRQTAAHISPDNLNLYVRVAIQNRHRLWQSLVICNCSKIQAERFLNSIRIK